MSAEAAARELRVLLPFDDAGNDPELVELRERLLEVVRQRDVQGLLAVLDPAIRNSFGGDGGVPEFEVQWKLGEPDSPVWEVLDTVLSMGGAFSGTDEFWAPYVFARFPRDFGDAGSGALIAADVALHSGPQAEAPVVATCSFAIARSVEFGTDGDWARVVIDGVGAGYVSSSSVRSVSDWRAGFTRSDSTWLLSTLVAGD